MNWGEILPNCILLANTLNQFSSYNSKRFTTARTTTKAKENNSPLSTFLEIPLRPGTDAGTGYNLALIVRHGADVSDILRSNKRTPQTIRRSLYLSLSLAHAAHMVVFSLIFGHFQWLSQIWRNFLIHNISWSKVTSNSLVNAHVYRIETHSNAGAGCWSMINVPSMFGAAAAWRGGAWLKYKKIGR